MSRRAWFFLFPLLAFLALAGFLAVGLNRNPREVPSPLVGQPAPDFMLPRLGGNDGFSPRAMRGKVWLLNVWASWCVACRQEHPVLVEMGKHRALVLVGLNYKEVRGDAAYDVGKIPPAEEMAMAMARANDWLHRHGDPYAFSVFDLDGRVGIDYGVYGVPETYVIDKAGVIRLKHIGPLTPELVSGRILPLVEALSQ